MGSVLPRQPSTQTDNSINNMSLISTIVLAVICAVAVSADHAMVHHAPHHAPHHPVTYGHGAGYYGYAPVHYKSPGQSYVHREMAAATATTSPTDSTTTTRLHTATDMPDTPTHQPLTSTSTTDPAIRCTTTHPPTDTTTKPTKPALPLPLINYKTIKLLLF